MSNNLLVRNIILSVFLLALVVIIIVTAGRTHFGSGEKSFTGKAGDRITRVEMTSEEGVLTLELNEGRWIVNKRYEARTSAVEFLRSILAGMRIKSAVSADLFVRDTTSQGNGPVKVKTHAGRKRNSSFIVFRTQSNSYGNFMKLNARSKPYIMHLPGFDGNIGSVFTVNENYWRPFTIFNLLPSEIASVEIRNENNSDYEFTITNYGGVPGFKAINIDFSGWDTSAVRRYISYFTYIPFEQWATDLPSSSRDSIIRSAPAFRIIVKETTGGSSDLQLWHRTGSSGKPDTDRLWGRINDNDNIFIVRYIDIDPILKKRSYFFGDRQRP